MRKLCYINMVTETQNNAFWWFTIAEELQRNENGCQKEHQLNQLAIPRKIETLCKTKRHARFTLQCALHASSLAQSTVDSSLIQYVMSCNSGYTECKHYNYTLDNREFCKASTERASRSNQQWYVKRSFATNAWSNGRHPCLNTLVNS